MKRKYICTNGVTEVSVYPVGDNQAGSPRWHRVKSKEDKRDENARQAVRAAARVLNCNYTAEDMLLTLTYTDEAYEDLFDGLTVDEVLEKAKPVAAKRLDRARKNFRKHSDGNGMKTFCVTADMDGETGELVRVHHHVVVTAAAAEAVEHAWCYGLVHKEHLYKQDDYTPLAAYLLEQVRYQEGRKKYACSQNMTKPKIEEQLLETVPDNEIKVQPGAKVLDRTPYREGMVSQYVRYKRKERTPKRGGHKIGEMGQTNCGRTDLCSKEFERRS